MIIDGKTGNWICYHCNDAGNAFDLYAMVFQLGSIQQTYFAPVAMYRIFNKILSPQQLDSTMFLGIYSINKLPVKNMATLSDCRKRLKKDKFFKMEISCLPDPKYRDIVNTGELKISSSVRLFVMPVLEDGELVDMMAVEPATNTYVIWED
jgi:hypothetical protein